MVTSTNITLLLKIRIRFYLVRISHTYHKDSSSSEFVRSGKIYEHTINEYYFEEKSSIPAD